MIRVRLATVGSGGPPYISKLDVAIAGQLGAFCTILSGRRM